MRLRKWYSKATAFGILVGLCAPLSFLMHPNVYEESYNRYRLNQHLRLLDKPVIREESYVAIAAYWLNLPAVSLATVLHLHKGRSDAMTWATILIFPLLLCTALAAPFFFALHRLSEGRLKRELQ